MVAGRQQVARLIQGGTRTAYSTIFRQGSSADPGGTGPAEAFAIMSSRHLRSFGLVTALAIAAGSAFVHCASPTEADEELTEDQITGVNNALGLGLRYDDKSG